MKRRLSNRADHAALAAAGLAVMIAAFGCSGNGSSSGRHLRSTQPDRAWAELMAGTTPPQPPAAWQTNAPSEAEVLEFSRRKGELAGEHAELARDFYVRWPKHPNAFAARVRELDLLEFAVQLGNTNRLDGLLAAEAGLAGDPRFDPDRRFQIQLRALYRQMEGVADTTSASALTRLEAGLQLLRKSFPTRPELADLMVSVADGWIHLNDLARASTLLVAVRDGNAPEELKAMAAARVSMIERVGTPLELKFTALDGREVDLAQLRGKVVLLDFWASYCAPCIEFLPTLQDVYRRFHDRGLEVLGISQDESDEEWLAFLKAHDMPWAHYRDGRIPDVNLGARFEIELIPTMWLVDRKGNLRYLYAEDGLADKVAKLLAE